MGHTTRSRMEAPERRPIADTVSRQAAARHDMRPEAVALRGLIQAMRSGSMATRSGVAQLAGPEHEDLQRNVVETSQPGVIQGVFDVPDTFAELIAAQAVYQEDAAAEQGGFTTVGFEHEFAQTGKARVDNPLRGLTHVEVATSAETMPYTGLDFRLETDADDALELVSPPFVVDTLQGSPTPNPDDIRKIDQLINSDLAGRVEEPTTLKALADSFANAGVTFTLNAGVVTASNVTPFRDKQYDTDRLVAVNALESIPVAASRKGSGVHTISSQANFATNAATYDALNAVSTPSGKIAKLFASLGATIAASITGRFAAPGANMRIFLREMGRQLAGMVSVPSIEWMALRGDELFAGDHKTKQVRNKLLGSEKRIFELHRGLRSHVKDASAAWLKDTLANFGLGLLSAAEWNLLLGQIGAIQAAMTALYKAANISDFNKDEKAEIRANLAAAPAHAAAALQALHTAITQGAWHVMAPPAGTRHGPAGRLAFGAHDPQWFGARQDTYIPGARVKTPAAFAASRLHVVEARGDHGAAMQDLAIVNHLRQPVVPSDSEITDATRPAPGPDEETDPRPAEDKIVRAARLARVGEIRAKLLTL